MAACNACGWTGDPGDCRDAGDRIQPGLCPDCLSTDVDAGSDGSNPGGDA